MVAELADADTVVSYQVYSSSSHSEDYNDVGEVSPVPACSCAARTSAVCLDYTSESPLLDDRPSARCQDPHRFCVVEVARRAFQ